MFHLIECEEGWSRPQCSVVVALCAHPLVCTVGAVRQCFSQLLFPSYIRKCDVRTRIHAHLHLNIYVL